MTMQHDHDTLDEAAGLPSAPIGRRKLLAGLSSAAALAAFAAAESVVAPAASAAPTQVVGLAAGAGNGVANRLALQAAFDAAQDGDTLQLPAGTYEIDVAAAPVYIDRSVTVVGSTGATPTVFDLVPNDHMTNPFLSVSAGLDGRPVVYEGEFRFSDFTINGPATAYVTPWNPTVQGQEPSPMVYGIGWGVRTSSGTFSVERVAITGAMSSGVMRSGMGLTRIIDCDIEAYISAVAIFDDTDTAFASGAVIKGGTHRTGTVLGSTTKYSSVGIYIHPCASLLLSDVTYEGWQRYAVYTNGEPDAAPLVWVVDGITVDGCGGLVQGATKIHSMFRGVKVRNGIEGPGSPIKGSATFVDCDLRGLIAPNLSGNRAEAVLRFVNCWLQPENLFTAHGHGYGPGTNGTVQFIGCTMAFQGYAGLITGTSMWQGTIELLDCDLYDCGSTMNQLIYLAGGSLRIDNTRIFTDELYPIWTEPNVPVTGAPEILPPATCPTPPS